MHNCLTGQVLDAAVSQTLDISSANVWFSFLRSTEEVFVVLGTSTEVRLYGWRGVFTVVQTLASNGVTGVTHFAPTLGDDILVVVNGGSPGDRETMSYVYRLSNTEELTVVKFVVTIFGILMVQYELVLLFNRSTLCQQLEHLMSHHSSLPLSGMWS